MARLFTDGAESGDTRGWTSVSSLTAVSTQARTGTYSYQAGNANTGTEVLSSALTEFYCRFAYRVASATAGAIFQWYNGATIAGSFRTASFGVGAATVTMYDGTTLRATSSAFTMNANEWHVFEIHVKMAANPTGVFEAKFDGTQVITFSGATNNQASMDRFVIIGPNATSYFDDIAFNDTAGGVDDTWCGDGGVMAALVPVTGAAQYADLIASTGNAWDCVNEIPVSTTSTWGDYVYESTVDKKSTYLMSDLAALPTGAAIARVWVDLAAGESAAAGGKIATLLRSGTTDTQGSDQVLTTALARYKSAEYLGDPGDSNAAWTSTKVNALQAGAVVR